MTGKKVLLWGAASFCALPCAAALASGGGGHTVGWVLTDTFRVMNFVVLAAALVFIFRKVGKPVLDDRIKGIEQELNELASKKEDAAKKLEEYTARLGTLEAEAQKIVESYVQQGETLKESILEEAKKAADRLTDQAQRHMEHEFAQAKARLRDEVLEKAISASREELEKSINEEDQNRLVGEYLDKVVVH